MTADTLVTPATTNTLLAADTSRRAYRVTTPTTRCPAWRGCERYIATTTSTKPTLSCKRRRRGGWPSTSAL